MKYHEEVFEIEMKIRETFNYILACNLSYKEIFDFLTEFEGVGLTNPDMSKEKGKREKRFKEYFENELFHITFDKFGKFKDPKNIKLESVFDFISRASDFNDLKNKIQNRGITDLLNPAHKTFIEDIATILKPLEDLRNDIMHNREIGRAKNLQGSEETDRKNTIANYQSAKVKFRQFYTNFWQQEKTRSADPLQQISYLLKQFNITPTEDDSFSYTDFDFEEQTALDRAELENQLLELIQNQYPEVEESQIRLQISEKIDTF